MSERSRDRPTLMDIAIGADVNVKTVLLALRGSTMVNPETAAKINRVALEIGYVRHKPLRLTLGVSLPFLGGFYREFMGALLGVAHDYEIDCLTTITGQDAAQEKKFIDMLIQRRAIDGFIFISSRLPVLELGNMARRGHSVVLVDLSVHQANNFAFGSVQIDHEVGAYKATNYLIGKGHERIAYLGVGSTSFVNQQRRSGYMKALVEHGVGNITELVVENAMVPMFDRDYLRAGYEECDRLLYFRQHTVDAIVAADDLIAIGAISALKNKGLKVPDDISVIGFGDLEPARFYVPSLTTVAVQVGRLALETLEVLSEMPETLGFERGMHRVITPDLLIRESVR